MEIGIILAGFVAKYTWLAAILFVMGCARAIFKPIFAAFRAYVEYTPNPADNVVLDKVEASSIYKGVAWVLDYLFSLKLIK